MAIYYLNVQIIGRSAGRSATGAAAYRAGERIVDERTGRVFDYTRRQGEIETEIHAPAGAPAWAQDRAQLWNQVEKMERRADAQVAREIVVAFPKELNPEQQRELIRGYVKEQFISRGMVADVAIHRNPGNPHAHIMLTMREIGSEGFLAKKNREWNKPEMLERWREDWAFQSNRALERAGLEERIDHRSLDEQGADRLPQVHLGPHSAALEKRGIETVKGDHNRAVAEHNATVVDLEKAREEKRRLEAEKAVLERYNARLKAGWLVPHARALGNLEYEGGGGALNRSAVDSLATEKRQELRSVEQQIHAIHREGQRLESAAEILGKRDKAAADVERLKSPLATVKRWFSPDAREEFRQAQDRFQGLDVTARKIGTTSGAELETQRSRWQQEKSCLPVLQEQGGAISRILELASKALEGFGQEQWRQFDRARQERSREPDRGR